MHPNLSKENDVINIRKPESELRESAELLRAGSKLTLNQSCIPAVKGYVMK